jgi:hypothetical protein
MNVNSAPGPDGFGPTWYSAAWATIKFDVLHLISSFHRGEADLNRINRAHIVLLPKCQGAATTPKDFRPVSLQNCPVKIITKILMTRLQRHIQLLTILIKQGSSRAGPSLKTSYMLLNWSNTVIATNILRTVVLKLDFAKPFDSVNWNSLLTNLSARGFPDKWLD